MKIKKIKRKSYKLLNFNLTKSKILKKNHHLRGINVENIGFRLKRILNLIYLYHISNKRILFVGSPMKIDVEIKSILSKTKHAFIPKFAWVKGVITNQYLYFTSLLKVKKNKSIITPKLLRILQLKTTKFDLMVIMDQESDFIALEEGHKANIPIITLNSNLNIFNNKADYKVPGNFILSKNILNNNLFYSILLSTLKKASFFEKKFRNKLQYKLSTIKKLNTPYFWEYFKNNKNYNKHFGDNKITTKQPFNDFYKKK